VPSVRADIYNNVVWDVAQSTSTSNPAGLTIDVRHAGNSDINVVGNTFNRIHGDGVRIVNGQLSPNRLSVNLFNNIFAGTRLAAINVTSETPSTLTMRAGANDFFSNGAPNHLEGQSLGSGNLHVNPGFTSPPSGDVSLKPTSPVINKGVVCSPGGIADPDIAGNHRLAGPTVDMGAFEYGSVVPTGVVMVGTAGPDSLVGTAGSDILCGYGGADQLSGGGRADYADGGAGSDQVTGGPGPDRLFGGPGGDLICAHDGHGNDYLDGGAGHDLYTADHGDVRRNVEQAGSCLV
jgi:hypothetical protein